MAAFITFEGGEGVGKSTQAQALADRLTRQGYKTLVTREPGGTPFGEAMRSALLAHADLETLTERLVFAAARHEHVERVISPALQAGMVVICDRFIDSTRVYQGHDPADAFARTLEARSIAGHLPDLTLILDLPVDLALARVAARGAMNRFDANAQATHEARRTAFLGLASAEPERCHVLDAAQTSTAVSEAVWALVSALLVAKSSGSPQVNPQSPEDDLF
ncbi:MAG: dTMP kinase [Pseudomonadota bacterium]